LAITHPDYAALVEPLFRCAEKRVGNDGLFFGTVWNAKNAFLMKLMEIYLRLRAKIARFSEAFYQII